MAIARNIEQRPIETLLLDPLNPRLGRRNLGLSQDKILEIIRAWEPEELAVSFIESGFWPQEALVVVADADIDQTNLVVVEGNRRLGALKLLKSAIDGAPRTRKWEELASQVRDESIFTSVPTLLADSRDDVRKFIGFRHVTGIKEWAPAEKAQYITDLVESGMSYEAVMRAIGSKTPTVRRNYISFNILKQIEDSDEVDVTPVEDRFSVLFLALREKGVQKFLGVDINADPEAAAIPVKGDEYVENLEFFVRWVFGTAEVPPLFSDSRFVSKFSRILESEEAVDYLKVARSPSLSTALSRAGADSDDVVEHLQAATDELEQSLSTVHLHADRPQVAEAVERLARDVAILLKSFPQYNHVICDAVEV